MQPAVHGHGLKNVEKVMKRSYSTLADLQSHELSESIPLLISNLMQSLDGTSRTSSLTHWPEMLCGHLLKGHKTRIRLWILR